MLINLLLFLMVGALAGFMAGLLGIGGGLVIVPALAVLLLSVAPEQALHLAVATSLACIVPTSISSLLAHHRRGAVVWPVMRRLTPGLVLGAIAGALTASALSGQTLTLVFALFCGLAGLQLWRGQHHRANRPLPGGPGLLSAGGGIGLISAMVGIGGGTLSVPWLLWHGFDIRRAVATAAACGLPIALAAVLAFVIAGWSRQDLPSSSLGFIHLPALAGVSVAAVLTAPLGARVAHKAPRLVLERVFASFLILLGAYFAWRGWHRL